MYFYLPSDCFLFLYGEKWYDEEKNTFLVTENSAVMESLLKLGVYSLLKMCVQFK